MADGRRRRRRRPRPPLALLLALTAAGLAIADPLARSAAARALAPSTATAVPVVATPTAAEAPRIGLGASGRPSAAIAPGAIQPPAAAAPLPAAPIPLGSAAGQALLLDRHTLRADYASLSQWLETQANLAYCGVASAVVALNSLGQPAPAATGYGSYRFWTQANLFAAPASLAVARPERVARQGMDLAQLQGLLSGQGVVAQRYHGDTLSLAQFRGLLRRSLADGGDRLLVNYHRAALGQQGGGHISPLAAYDPRGDRVLILDVARYRYPPVWVSAADLWRAVRTLDSSSGRSRGLVLVRTGTGDGAAPPATTPPSGR
jgi:hypothetical protein